MNQTALITQEALDQFTGSENYTWGDLRRCKCTDGVQFLRDNGAAWLITLICSYQYGSLLKVPFQLWELTVDKDGTGGVITCREDSGQPDLKRQVVGFTDFPLPYIKLYLIDGVLLLPSEY